MNMAVVAAVIEPLSARPQWVAQLADWHHAEWGALYAGAWSHADALRELQEQARGEQIPATWIARDGERLLGSVSLVVEDADELQRLGPPWMASLFVRPQARGRGIGAALVRHAVAVAAALAVPQLRLFTTEHANWYRGLGWQDERADLVGGHPVQVMRCFPAPGRSG